MMDLGDRRDSTSKPIEDDTALIGIKMIDFVLIVGILNVISRGTYNIDSSKHIVNVL
jgi:hypothetical protein